MIFQVCPAAKQTMANTAGVLKASFDNALHLQREIVRLTGTACWCELSPRFGPLRERQAQLRSGDAMTFRVRRAGRVIDLRDRMP